MYQLIIRGTTKATSLEEARTIHNQTAGNPQGVAAARSLGDLSHNVFVPLADDAAKASELLFLDTWTDVNNMNQFFSDPQVQGGAAMMFETRDPVVATPADAYCYTLQAPRDRPQRFVGMLRATVASKDAVKTAYARNRETVVNARKLGIISRQLYFRLESLELFAIDLWHDAEGMGKFYAEPTPAEFKDLFTSKPIVSPWKQPTGHWIEW